MYYSRSGFSKRKIKNWEGAIRNKVQLHDSSTFSKLHVDFQEILVSAVWIVSLLNEMHEKYSNGKFFLSKFGSSVETFIST